MDTKPLPFSASNSTWVYRALRGAFQPNDAHLATSRMRACTFTKFLPKLRDAISATFERRRTPIPQSVPIGFNLGIRARSKQTQAVARFRA